MRFTNFINKTSVALFQLTLASLFLVSNSLVASTVGTIPPVVTYVLDEEKKCPGENFSIDCIVESYANNLTVTTENSGTVTWEDSGTNGVVSLATTGGADQAAIFLPVIPLGFTYADSQAISSIAYQLTSTTAESAVFNVQLARTIGGPFCTVQHKPALASTGSIDASAGEWFDRCDSATLGNWATVQTKYDNRWSINQMWLSLGTGQGISTSKVDHVTINGSDLYDFVYTGIPGGSDLGPEYKNPITVQETNGATADWTKPTSTNGAVTLSTPVDDSQAVVNLPILPLGIEFATLSEITSVIVNIAENTNKNVSINIQVYDDPINGPYTTLQLGFAAGFTGEVDTIDLDTWIDRSTGDEGLEWADILTNYPTESVNRIWLSLGTGQGISSSSIDHVTINGSKYDFVAD